ncbi:MAG: type IV pilus assembly protein PilM [Deltaproteobacteria bacterium]|nr:type IV pilus assembly protein PilM [Deltaproteobacteria bacterium]
MDIGSSSVKMLEVRDTKDALCLVSAGIAPLPSDAVQGNVVRDPKSVAQALRTLMASQHVRTSEVITAVPGPAAIVKRATFPLQPANDLHETILFEAGNYIPENLEDVNLDYHILDFIEEANAVEVVLVAVRKEVMDSYISAIRDAGLVPILVDVDYFALENMVEANYASSPEEIFVLLHIGARCSLISVLKRGCTVFTGDVPVGGALFTETLSRELGLSHGEAEELKIFGSMETARQRQAEDALAPIFSQLLDETERMLSFFWAGETTEQLPTVYLSGGSARLPGLVGLVSERLQAPVILSDPFRALSMSRHVDERFVRDHASALAISMGLATRRPGDK